MTEVAGQQIAEERIDHELHGNEDKIHAVGCLVISRTMSMVAVPKNRSICVTSSTYCMRERMASTF